MANDAAWQQGWDLGAGKKKSTKKQADSTDDDSTKPCAGTGGQTYFHGGKRKTSGSSSSDSGGGGMSWSILPVIGKALGIGSKKKGGPIRKTGLYLLHKHEYVVPAKHGRGRKVVSKRSLIKA